MVHLPFLHAICGQFLFIIFLEFLFPLFSARPAYIFTVNGGIFSRREKRILYCPAVFGPFLTPPPRKSSPWGSFSDGGSLVVGPFD